MGEGQAFFFNPTQNKRIQLWHCAGDTVAAPDIDGTTRVSACAVSAHELAFNPIKAVPLHLLQTNVRTPIQRVVWCDPSSSEPCTFFKFHQDHARGPVSLSVVFS